ncbi:phosphatidylinositol 4-phosphate 5-kinase-like protein 1 isoform X1 [Callorhinchus milii]|uniref:phosphatidylinositol 4-phosphate 5-kinase-like protein 1 isoform X1 n=2 Tax=Callorhinchus milii TaxID=7868 RepID=UPI0004571AB5|nr:phosphatidylinositol 4-phosphate 5-kinase-like protein 1 isoform X1 [Callorhinchus milii]|eukprot:gi/632964571/ref/XP_007898462.1/ PREDICTED: phosphatidylinositol 4-phosphate 5-kinase-like protein 1 isoform X2 [Callorhinchus milii]
MDGDTWAHKEAENREASVNQRPTMKGKFLWRLRQKWKLLGLFEIDSDHEFYYFTCVMKEGLAAAVQISIDNPNLSTLSDPDFKAVLTQVHKGFEMQTYAASVFAQFRQTLGMTEKEYQHSLASEGCYLQFISNSKSKANFFLTNDKRVFLKTQKKREIKFLLSKLKSYIQHIQNYPHSLLVKFLGVHSVSLPQGRKKYFIIMQSVFYPDERIVARYDIKGCQVSRWTDPSPEGSQIIVVLKDLNFKGNMIGLDQQRSWFIRQIEIDTEFLKGWNVIDYSLLVAFQPLHPDERRLSSSFANIILRTKKSMITGGSPTTSTRAPIPGLVEEASSVLEMERDAELGQSKEVPPHSRSEIPLEKLMPGGSSELEVPEVAAQNRRLLPGYKNPLHVIDGTEFRYFVGIVDMFTVYGFRKKIEYLWKCIRHRGQSFSTVNPDKYARRLCQWVDGHIV